MPGTGTLLLVHSHAVKRNVPPNGALTPPTFGVAAPILDFLTAFFLHNIFELVLEFQPENSTNLWVTFRVSVRYRKKCCI